MALQNQRTQVKADVDNEDHKTSRRPSKLDSNKLTTHSALITKIPAFRSAGSEPLSTAPNPLIDEADDGRQIRSFDDIINRLALANNIVIISGAGISTSSGIPDFRSPTNGIYNSESTLRLLQKYYLNDPQELFGIELFHQQPEAFYELFPRLLPPSFFSAPPASGLADGITLTHRFIHALEESGKLLTLYTQNIDGFETRAGVKEERMIRLHGNMSILRCLKCGHKMHLKEMEDDVRAGKILYCTVCSVKSQTKRRRSVHASGNKLLSRKKRGEKYDDDDGNESEDDVSGLLKPDIVFFGEPLHVGYIARLEEESPNVELVLVMGTSLTVKPASEMIDKFPHTTTKVWINDQEASTKIKHKFHAQLIGTCDDVSAALWKRADMKVTNNVGISKFQVNYHGDQVWRIIPAEERGR